MFERLTDRDRPSLVLAQEESRTSDHGGMAVGHLLLGGAISAAIPATGGDSAGRSEGEDEVIALLQQIVHRLDRISDQLRSRDQ